MEDELYKDLSSFLKANRSLRSLSVFFKYCFQFDTWKVYSKSESQGSWTPPRSRRQRIKLELEFLQYIAKQMCSEQFKNSNVVPIWLYINIPKERHITKLFSRRYVEVEYSTHLEYFLHYAYKHRVLFRGELRLANVDTSSPLHFPCRMTIRRLSPMLLKLFLRYGAMHYPGIRLNWRISDFYITFNEIIDREYDEAAGVKQPIVLGEKAIECGRLLLRSCGSFSLTELLLARPWKTEEENVYRAISKFSAIWPSFPLRCKIAMELKHACRLTIRQLCHNNWNLPRGLKKLDLPQTLKDYLDLEYD